MSKCIGPKMGLIRDYVSAVPGCSQADAMRASGTDPRSQGAYCANRPMGRAIASGLILMEHDGPQLTRLFATERDRTIYHLRRELLTPGTPAERIAEIRIELARLDAERAATWRA